MAYIPGNSIQPFNDPPAPDLAESVPSGRSEFTSLLNQKIRNNGNSNISDKQEMGPGSHIRPERGSDPEGNTRLCKRDDAASINVTDPQVKESMGDEASEETAGNSENLPTVCRCMAHESEDGEETEGPHDGSGPADENGLKMGDLLFKMLTAFLEANNADPTTNLSGENENREVAEGPSAVPENPSTAELPAENGLKIGAMLYELLNASLELYTDSPQPDVATQCNNDTDETGQAARTGVPSENGLKAGIILSELGADGKQIDSVVDGDGLMTALAQTTDEEAPGVDAGNSDTSGKTSGQSDNKNMHQLETVFSPEENINPDSNESSVISATRTRPMPETAKEGANAAGPQSAQSGPENNLKVEATSDSSSQVNQQNVSLQSGRAADGPVSGQAARPAGFTQVMDNAVYVMKGNNRLGVSVEHDTLGKLDINLRMDKGMLNVQINTSERHTREFIENNIQSIMDSLAKEGVTIGGFSVALKERNDHERSVFDRDGGSYQEKEIFPTEEMNSVKRGLVNVFA